MIIKVNLKVRYVNDPYCVLRTSERLRVDRSENTDSTSYKGTL